MKNFATILVVAIIGISVVVPFVTQAQTATSSGASLIAVLTQLIEVLEQELRQLLAQPLNNPVSFSATPTSGTVPLTVRFSATDKDTADHTGGNYYIEFGDGGSDAAEEQCAQGVCIIKGTHTYPISGTFIATLFWATVPYIPLGHVYPEGKSRSDAGEELANVTVTTGN